MNVNNFLRKDFLKVGPDTKISEIAAKMMKGEEAAAVVDGSRFLGIISANNLIDRDYPAETKAKNLARKNVPKIEGDLDIFKLAKMFLENNIKAIPVLSGGKLLGLVFESDIVQNSETCLSESNKTVKEIASMPVVISRDENIGKARTLTQENDINRLPVIDSEGRLEGVIDIEGFLKTVNPQESMGKKDSAGDYTPEYRLSVTTIMNRNPVTTVENINCNKIVKLFKKYNTSYVIITSDKKPVGIVTSKDILELVASLKKKEGVYVQISGLEEIEDSFERDKIDSLIEDSVKKIGKIYGGIEYLFLHIKSSQKEGEQKLYSIRTRILTPVGLYVSKSQGWNPIKTADEALERLERQVTEDHEKHRERPKKIS